MDRSLRSTCARIAPAVLLAMLASACATDRTPPPASAGPITAGPVPAGPVATVPVSVDGTYQGTKQLVSGGDGPGTLCGTLDPLSIVVAGRTFHYILNQPEVPYQPTRPFAATIDAAGSFQSATGPAYMRGQAGGGHMQGEISGDACGYHFEADRVGS